jgi:hypothetical protein
MATTIGKVRAVFTASTSGLTSGVNQASSSFKRLESDVKGLRSGLSTLTAISGAQLFGQLASAASQAIGSLVRMGQAEAEVIDKTSKLAARLGMTYGEFSGLALAGDLAGVGMDTIANAAGKADVAFVKAMGGSKVAQAAFTNLGLSLEQLNGMTAADRFDAIASAIAALPTEAQRAAAAVQLFGRSGQELLPLFAGGAQGIAQARAEAERFGLALTNVQGTNVEAMNDSFTRAQAAVRGVIQQVVAYLAPAIESVTTAFSNLIGSVGGTTIGQTIGEGILQGAKFLAQIGDFLIANLSKVWAYVSQVGGQWNSVFQFGSRTAAFFAGIGDALQAAFGVIILGISGPVQGLIYAAQQIGQALGFDTAPLDSALAGMEAFNSEIASGIEQNINSAAANFNKAIFGDDASANKLGEAVAGPLTTSVDAAINRAREAAAAVDVSKPVEIDQKVEVAAGSLGKAVSEAVKGVDIRSREGVAEMFRIMRGDTGGNVQERQLSALEQIASNTANMGIDIESVDLAPAAGGY